MAKGDPPRSSASSRENQFERAYRDHFPRVRSFLRVYVGSIAAADDLAQDTFLQLWSKPEAFNPQRAGLRTYLLGIARKKAADWWRHSERPADTPPNQAGDSAGNSYAIKDALAKLDADFRNVLWLREVEGYSYDELARILGIPLGTVKSRLFAAREQLRQTWKSIPKEEA